MVYQPDLDGSAIDAANGHTPGRLDDLLANRRPIEQAMRARDDAIVGAAAAARYAADTALADFAERVVVHSAPEHVSNTVVLEIVANQITLVVGFDQDLARSTAHALLAALRQINQGVPR